jgi:hydrophobe/amphiphile efflux-1 (HAE1) family protein
MEELSARPDWPAGVTWRVPYDTTSSSAEHEGRDDHARRGDPARRVVVVVFLQSWRASLIPLAAVPVSLIGTCAVMWAMGFTLNNLSMFGLVLAIGIVVDDAIVVVENVERWIEQGLAPREATYRAMTEVTPAVIAVAAGLSAVFVPTAFITGITGQFYKQFALTIAVSTLISAFNSLTLSPALAAILLRPHGAKPDWLTRAMNFTLGWFFRLFNRVLGAGTNAYVGSLRRLTRVAALVMVVYGGLLVLTYFAFQRVPTGFIPTQDKGYVIANLQMPDASSIQRTDATIRRMAEIAHQTPGVKYTFAIAGFSALSFTNQSNTGAMFVTLEDFDKRGGDPALTQEAIIGNLMREYSQIQDGFALVFPPPAVAGMGIAGGFKMQIQDRAGRSPQDLQAVTEQVIAAATQDPRITQALTSFRAGVPQLYANIDREKVKTQDVAVTDVFEALQTYLGSVYVNDFNFLGRTYQVTAQADAPFRARAEDVARIETRNAQGRMVPLGSVMEIKDITGPVRIGRYNLRTTGGDQRRVGARRGEQRGQRHHGAGANENLPPGFGYEWTELTFQENLANQPFLGFLPVTVGIFGMCVLLVFLVHAAEYESWSLPTAIILIVPMCLLAAMAGVMLRGMDNNIFTQIGFVVLAGLSAEERRADRRVRQAAGRAPPRHQPHAGRPRGLAPAPAADPHDQLRVHPRRAAARARRRRRLRDAPGPGHDRLLRDDRRDVLRHLPDARCFTSSSAGSRPSSAPARPPRDNAAGPTATAPAVTATAPTWCRRPCPRSASPRSSHSPRRLRTELLRLSARVRRPPSPPYAGEEGRGEGPSTVSRRSREPLSPPRSPTHGRGRFSARRSRSFRTQTSARAPRTPQTHPPSRRAAVRPGSGRATSWRGSSGGRVTSSV